MKRWTMPVAAAAVTAAAVAAVDNEDSVQRWRWWGHLMVAAVLGSVQWQRRWSKLRRWLDDDGI